MTNARTPNERLRELETRERLRSREPLPMWLFDLQWLDIVAVNATAIASYGYSEAEFLRLTMTDLLHPEDLGRFLASIEPGAARHDRRAPWRHLLRDGRSVSIRSRVERFEHRGEATALLVARMAAEPRGAAGAPAAAGGFSIQRIVEADTFIPLVVFDMNAPQMPAVFVNAAFEQLSGYSQRELLGAGLRSFPGDTPGQPGMQQLVDAVAAGRASVVRLENRRKDGSAVVHEVQLRPVRDAAGRLTHYIRMQADATDRIRSAETLRRTESAIRDKEAAEFRSRTKTEFLARLSHELRTPLNAVIGFAELLALQDGSFDARQGRYLEHILDAGRHLLSLVDDVLDLQRVDERRVPLLPRPLDLAQFIAAETALLTPLLTRQSLTMHNDVPAGLVVQADERCLRQALLNLATNAIKYNRPAGVVRWTASVIRPGFAVLMISDTGHGISREQIPRLFQPFDRLGKEGSPHEGTGLGLLIARGLVEHMGGRLDVESGLGVGTQVLVELPLAEPHSLFGELMNEPAESRVDTPVAPRAIVVRPSARVQSNLMPTIRLLYVEDNRINAMLFEAVLGARPDIELRIAETGWEALDIVEKWTPDVLVLDANLPDMHGVRLLRELRAIESLKSTPAFMCSADAMEEDVRLAREAGFSDYWTKPVDFNKVLADLRGLARTASTASSV